MTHTLELTQMFHYETTDGLFEALEKGEIDCVVDDEPIIRFYIARHPNRGFRLLELIEQTGYAIPFRKESAALRGEIDRELRALLDDGTVDTIVERWMVEETTLPPERPVMGGRVVRAGVFIEAEPFGFINADGQVAGIEVEILTTIARRLGYDLRIQPMTFDALFDALLAGEVDIITGCIAMTEDRKQMFDFSLPYYEGGVAAVVHDKK
ncbi:MAG: transporter substrate-binding domain-containing protein [Planctomycetes bacterium]|nr:transporter substrate-binding domain-containing protein [Planctomycetota bacterium]